MTSTLLGSSYIILQETVQQTHIYVMNEEVQQSCVIFAEVSIVLEVA